MGIILPSENENNLIYPTIRYENFSHGLILSYIYGDFENFLSGKNQEKIGSIKSLGRSETNSHFLNLNLILNNNLRLIFDQIKNNDNFDFLRNDQKTYEYIIKFEVLKQFLSSIELENPEFFEHLKSAGIILEEKYFFLNELIKKTNNLNF